MAPVDIFVYAGIQEMIIEKQIISIPNDVNMTFLEFMMLYSSHLQLEFSTTSMSMAYTVYIIDRSFLQSHAHVV